MITFLFLNETKVPKTFDFTKLIGATGFEPATSRPPAVRATKLRHTPRTSYILPNPKQKINHFFRKIYSNFSPVYCTNCMLYLKYYRLHTGIRKEVFIMDEALSFIIAVAAGVVCHYIIKWLDSDK